MAIYKMVRKLLVLLLLTFVLVFSISLLTFYGIEIEAGKEQTQKVFFVDRDICVTDTKEFINALAKQDLGVTQIEQWRLTWTLFLEADYKAQWDTIPKYYNTMWMKVKQKLHILQLVAEIETDELKYMIDLKNNEEDCNIVTLGVGFNIRAEQAILKHRPQCHFLGADPEINGNQDLYEGLSFWSNTSMSRFVHIAVRGSEGYYSGDFWQKDGTIKTKTVKSMEITKFFQDYNKNKLVDLLLVDVEGSEYEILEKLVEDYKLLPTICQINVEFHHPLEQFNATYERFFWNLDRLLLNGYILLNTDYYKPAAFLRMFFVNFLDEKCQQQLHLESLDRVINKSTGHFYTPGPVLYGVCDLCFVWCVMNTHISLDAREPLCLLEEIRKKIETESKCQICWELSIGPVICSHCGNNVGCSKCVNGLFNNQDHSARCPLCNGEWRRASHDLANTSLWTGHCPNRALACILNEINHPPSSGVTAKKPSLIPSAPPKSPPITKHCTPPKFSSRRPYCPAVSRNRLAGPPPFENEKNEFQWEAHRFLAFRYCLLFIILCGYIHLISNQASFWKIYQKGLSFIGLFGGTIICLCAISLHLILLGTLWESFCEAKSLAQTRRINKLVQVKLLHTILDLISILIICVYLIITNVRVLEFVGIKALPSPTEFVVFNFLFVCFLLAYEGMIAFVSVDNFPSMFPKTKARSYRGGLV